jgi:hypothetical protein
VTQLVRAKITAFAGSPGGTEGEYTFTIQVEEGGGVVTYSGVQPENLPFWGTTVQVDPAKLVGTIIMAQMTRPQNIIECWFIVPPMVADCGQQPPSPGTMTDIERMRQGIPAVSPSDTGNTAPEGGGPI